MLCRMAGEMLYELMILPDDIVSLQLFNWVLSVMLEFWCWSSMLRNVFSLLVTHVLVTVFYDNGKMMTNIYSNIIEGMVFQVILC